MTVQDLKPCNICNGDVHFVDQGYDPRWGPAFDHIYCGTCSEDYVLDFCISKNEMIKLWNDNFTGEK